MTIKEYKDYQKELARSHVVGLELLLEECEKDEVLKQELKEVLQRLSKALSDN